MGLPFFPNCAEIRNKNYGEFSEISRKILRIRRFGIDFEIRSCTAAAYMDQAERR